MWLTTLTSPQTSRRHWDDVVRPRRGMHQGVYLCGHGTVQVMASFNQQHEVPGGALLLPQQPQLLQQNPPQQRPQQQQQPQWHPSQQQPPQQQGSQQPPASQPQVCARLIGSQKPL